MELTRRAGNARVRAVRSHSALWRGCGVTATRTIPIGKRGQYQVTVDARDYEFLTQWKWSYVRAAWRYGANIYARRHRRVNGRRETVLMHVLILTERKGNPRPTPAHTCHHLNLSTLNNTRRNLEWATQSKQSREQRRRITAAERAAYGAAA